MVFYPRNCPPADPAGPAPSPPMSWPHRLAPLPSPGRSGPIPPRRPVPAPRRLRLGPVLPGSGEWPIVTPPRPRPPAPRSRPEFDRPSPARATARGPMGCCLSAYATSAGRGRASWAVRLNRRWSAGAWAPRCASCECWGWDESARPLTGQPTAALSQCDRGGCVRVPRRWPGAWMLWGHSQACMGRRNRSSAVAVSAAPVVGAAGPCWRRGLRVRPGWARRRPGPGGGTRPAWRPRLLDVAAEPGTEGVRAGGATSGAGPRRVWEARPWGPGSGWGGARAAGPTWAGGTAARAAALSGGGRLRGVSPGALGAGWPGELAAFTSPALTPSLGGNWALRFRKPTLGGWVAAGCEEKLGVWDGSTLVFVQATTGGDGAGMNTVVLGLGVEGLFSLGAF